MGHGGPCPVGTRGHRCRVRRLPRRPGRSSRAGHDRLRLHRPARCPRRAGHPERDRPARRDGPGRAGGGVLHLRRNRPGPRCPRLPQPDPRSPGDQLMASAAWSTQQLAEFVASVSPCTTEASAARAAVERAAEVLDAEVVAIVAGGELLAAVGYPEGTEPVDELKRIRPGALDSRLKVPGVGWCPVSAAGLAYPPGATLVLARPHGLTREETALLGGMA